MPNICSGLSGRGLGCRLCNNFNISYEDEMWRIKKVILGVQRFQKHLWSVKEKILYILSELDMSQKLVTLLGYN